MRYIWRKLTGRCPRCGQRLNGHQAAGDSVLEINSRATHLTEVLERSPLTQNCSECGRIVFEGEPGFVQRYLLVDIL